MTDYFMFLAETAVTTVAAVIVLAPLPPAVVALGVLDFAAPPLADRDAYAVAWDALGGDLPTDGTEDARRARDGIGGGRPVPPWDQRAALARCVVRLELTK